MSLSNHKDTRQPLSVKKNSWIWKKMQVTNHTNVCMTILKCEDKFTNLKDASQKSHQCVYDNTFTYISHKSNNINSMKYVQNAWLGRRKNAIVET